jgi:hypothetical protein
MAVPIRTGTLQAYSSGSGDATIDVSSVSNGSWMLLVAMANTSSATLTAPSNWTTLVSSFVLNTRRVAVFGKIKDGSDGTAAVPKGMSAATSLGLVYGTGADVPATWQIGTDKTRATAPAESTTTTALSITTTALDVLALSISTEATNAEDTVEPITSGSGWLNWLYVPDLASPDTTNIEQIRIGYKEMPTTGATSDATDTYQNAQTFNGWGIQVGITSSNPGSSEGEITVVNTTTGGTTGTGTSTNLVLNVPAGLQNGDWLIVAARSQISTGASDFSCSGWSRVGPAWPGSSASARVVGFFAHRVDDAGGEPASYTFERSGAATRNIGTMIAVRGLPPTDYLDAAVTDYYGTTVVGGKQTESLTVTAENALQLFLGSAEFTATNSQIPSGTPGGFTEIALATTDTDTGISRTAVWFGQKDTTLGGTGTSSITWGSPIDPVAQSIVIRPATSVPDSYELTVYDGSTEVPATVWVYDGVDELPVQDVLGLPWHSFTVSEMEDDVANARDTYWAHRGGSLDWSEMSMRAYTNAVFHGAKTLEISVHRSSDGVWIMSHDADLTRVTATTHTIISTPSSTMLGLPIDTPTTGGVIGRIEDVLDAYKDMLLIVDNKPGSWQTEFFDLLKAHVPNWAEHIIIKIDGGASISRFQNAQAAGFKTAAYWYHTSNWGVGGVPDKIAYVDYPGLNYDADVSYWNDLLALSGSKPIWGHVLPNQTAKNTAKTKGAKIFQCSGVTTIIPKINDLP